MQEPLQSLIANQTDFILLLQSEFTSQAVTSAVLREAQETDCLNRSMQAIPMVAWADDIEWLQRNAGNLQIESVNDCSCRNLSGPPESFRLDRRHGSSAEARQES